MYISAVVFYMDRIWFFEEVQIDRRTASLAELALPSTGSVVWKHCTNVLVRRQSADVQTSARPQWGRADGCQFVQLLHSVNTVLNQWC